MVEVLKFKCDGCGEDIKTANVGWFEWVHDIQTGYDKDWRIYHHITSGKECFPTPSPKGCRSYHLHHAIEQFDEIKALMNPHPDHMESYQAWLKKMNNHLLRFVK